MSQRSRRWAARPSSSSSRATPSSFEPGIWPSATSWKSVRAGVHGNPDPLEDRHPAAVAGQPLEAAGGRRRPHEAHRGHAHRHHRPRRGPPGRRWHRHREARRRPEGGDRGGRANPGRGEPPPPAQHQAGHDLQPHGPRQSGRAHVVDSAGRGSGRRRARDSHVPLARAQRAGSGPDPAAGRVDHVRRNVFVRCPGHDHERGRHRHRPRHGGGRGRGGAGSVSPPPGIARPGRNSGPNDELR